jgi:tRNA nucleotidyltransferase/poly(A) polymerase
MPIQSARFELSFVPGDVLKVMDKIYRAGSEVWIVGGALRDYFLAIEPKDWDLATSADTGKIISIFPRVIPVGIRHGTVQVHTRTRDIEVTSFDPAGEAGLLKDLGRRDFTINSLALSYPEGILIDAHGGREDLKACLIRAVGNPAARFSEDPLRIVRAARICAVYGFRIDHATFQAMQEGSGKLGEVSGERIRDEILKILPAANFSTAFDLLRKSGALGRLLPGLDAAADVATCRGSGASIFEHTLACILNCPNRTRVRLAALFHDMPANMAGAGPRIESPGSESVAGSAAFAREGTGVDAHQADLRSESARSAADTMKKWNMSNRYIYEVSTLVRRRLPQEAPSWSDADIRRFLIGVRPELLDDFIALAEAEVLCGAHTEAAVEGIRRLGARMKTQLGLISALSVRELALSGDEVMKILGLSPGPQVGKILKHLFDLVQEDPSLNTREHLARIVETKYKTANR